MSVRIVGDLDAEPWGDSFAGAPSMAATLALTSSGSISPVSDLDAEPWGDSFAGAPSMAATLALAAWA